MEGKEGRAPRGETAGSAAVGGLGGMIPLIPSFAGDPDGLKVTDFFESLDEIGKLTNWTKAQCLGVAKLRLTGIARDFAWKDATMKDVTTYDEFKKLMIKRFEKEPISLQLQKFHACVQAPGEDVQTYAVRLQTLVVEIIKEQPSDNAQEREVVKRCQQKERDKRLLVQFMSGLNDRIKRHVMSKEPDTFDKAVRIAISEESIEQLTGKSRGIIRTIDNTSEKDTNHNPLEETLTKIQEQLQRLTPSDYSRRDPRRGPPRGWRPRDYRDSRRQYQSSGGRGDDSQGPRDTYFDRTRRENQDLTYAPRYGTRNFTNNPRGRGIGRARSIPPRRQAYGRINKVNWQKLRRGTNQGSTKDPPYPRRNHFQSPGETNHFRSSRITNEYQAGRGMQLIYRNRGGIKSLGRDFEPNLACRINGYAVRLAIDTGSKVTLLSYALAQRIAQVQLDRKKGTILFQSVTGHGIITYGALDVCFEIGPLRFSYSCYIVDNVITQPFDGLLGRDIITSQGLTICLAREILILPKGEEIPFQKGPKRQRTTTLAQVDRKRNYKGTYIKSGKYTRPKQSSIPDISKNRPPEPRSTGNSEPTQEVVLLTDCNLSPRTEVITMGRIIGVKKKGLVGIIEAGKLQQDGVAGADILVKTKKGGQVPIRISNFSTQPRKIPKGECIGTFLRAMEDNPSPTSKPINLSPNPTITKEEFSRLFDWSHIGKEKKKPLLDLLYKYHHVFATHDYDLGYCQVVEHEINTGDASPIYQPPYRIPYAQREKMNEIIDELLENKIITHSKSPWSAPALLVKKKDPGLWRLVIDYRKLNKVTKNDPYPLPLVQEALSLMGQAKYFSTMDTLSGFWQLALKDKEKSAFSSPDGHYQWNRMPMGLAGSPASWQRAADFILHGLKGKTCLVYMDDILTFSSDFQSHLTRLEQIFQRLAAAGLKLKPKKCHFLQRQIKFLGHEVSDEGIRPDPDKINCVLTFPKPVNKHDIKSFLGLTGYYRRHIKSYADIAKPLTNLLKNDAQFQWGEEQEQSFERLKEIITSAPLLKSPDFSKPFILATDASNEAIGAVLSQEDERGEMPIAYASRILRKPEKNYSTTEKECLAVVWATKYFKPYLYGRKFTIITDHRPLRWLMSNKDSSSNSRIARWIIFLQEFDFTITHKAGDCHKNADALSRIPIRQITQKEELVPIYSKTQIRDLQRRDPKWNSIIQNLENNITVHPNLEKFFLDEEETLYHLQPTNQGDTLEQLVIPSILIPYILHTYHDTPIGGHLGPQKMLQKLQPLFFWSTMNRDIKNYCQNCQRCALHKRKDKRTEAELQLFPPLTHLFERTAMDIVGPLPITNNGNKYILVFVDHFSRYAEAIPLPNTLSKTIAKAFVVNIILRHSTPVQLLTDRAPNLISKMFKEVCELLQIKRLLTTAYHPACNGIVERFNRTLIDIISHYVSKDQQDWDEWIPYALFAYNTTIHASTNDSPFFLLYGRDPTYPFDLITRPTRTRYDVEENFAAELQLRMANAHRVAQEHAEQAARERQKQHRRTHKISTYQVGDRVFLNEIALSPGLKKKLAPRWSGPFRIITKLSPVTFIIENIQTKKTLHVHANRLKHGTAQQELEEMNESETQSIITSNLAKSKDPLPSTSMFIDPWDEVILTEIQQQAESEREDEEDVTTEEKTREPELTPSPPYALRSQGPVEEQPWILPTPRRSRIPKRKASPPKNGVNTQPKITKRET
ncbi:uncharacterized protein LOC111641862 [Centruroides sculpturatus]|uniref:uncharacterized protein LOC111641862 n=1 Tax=Centruroides sculpturatus TaxID=218467 RepID=UPI000C6CD1AA|nr:uncharacterized protein LOC111641862 [Centruroides sculpturatus]